jgi:putative IMPACT (imprinted ancient) family translation regulator
MQEITDSYKTIKEKSEGLYKEKGSKFIANAIPVANEEEVKDALEDIKKMHHSARHHCYEFTSFFFV